MSFTKWKKQLLIFISSHLGRMKLNITDGSLRPQAQQRASAQSDSHCSSGQSTKQQHSLNLQLIFADI